MRWVRVQRLSQRALASMLVAVRAMHMAVGNFFSGWPPARR